MTTYKAIQGYTVEKLSSDPSPDIEGKLFYNDTSNTFKIVAAGTAAWATTNSLTDGIRQAAASAGTTASASMTVGGYSTPAPPVENPTTKCESFDGTNWTTVSALNTSRARGFGGGSLTAAIVAGGQPDITAVELWNGASWTTNPATTGGTATYYRGSNGTQTSILAYGGTSFSALCEEWNGTSWTETTNINTARLQVAGAGANATTSLAFGGQTPRPPPPSGSQSAAAEEWNGASWTTVASIGSARSSNGSFGTVTSGFRTGGYPTTYDTEEFNGTSWTETSNNNSNKYDRNHNGGGSAASAMASGGYSPQSDVSEEWALAPLAARTVTTS